MFLHFNEKKGKQMKFISKLIFSFCIILTSMNTFASDSAEALAKKSGCLNCHSIGNKIIGPAFSDVAAKYKTVKTAEATLTEKVKKGGSGVWGNMPMPPNSPQVKDQDIKTIVKWILSL
jgi:cytochrome c